MSARDDDAALRRFEDVAALREALRQLDLVEQVVQGRALVQNVDPVCLIDTHGLPVLLPVIVARVQGLAALVIRGVGDLS